MGLARPIDVKSAHREEWGQLDPAIQLGQTRPVGTTNPSWGCANLAHPLSAPTLALILGETKAKLDPATCAIHKLHSRKVPRHRQAGTDAAFVNVERGAVSEQTSGSRTRR